MSASFILRASKSDDLSLFKKIVIASNWIEAVVIRQSDVIANDRRECGNLILLFKIKFPLSLLSSQRRLLCYSARAVDDHSQGQALSS